MGISFYILLLFKKKYKVNPIIPRFEPFNFNFRDPYKILVGRFEVLFTHSIFHLTSRSKSDEVISD